MTETETRVGYMTIDILLQFTTEAIKAQMVDGKYQGPYELIYKAQKMDEYLRGEEHLRS